MPKSRALPPSIGTGHAETSESFAIPLLLSDDSGFLLTFLMGMTGPVSWVANFCSSAELSPFLGAEGFLGKRMSLEQYSFRRCTLACRESVDLFCLLGSTEMPVVRVTFL
uniref:cDNA FLJ30941 fis, clone FEBRA2007458 n=1 Tax=Homo sapiens TaxID=9606 RepID=A8K5S6_HUMAN|nr:unnamed protein product [Homo sapiens]BAG51528.1 unnamed protein product [Homo sapiens]